MILYKPGLLIDGDKNPNVRRFVIFEDFILLSKTSSMDHVSLEQGLASRLGLKQEVLKSKSIRGYYLIERSNNVVIFSGSRKLDADKIEIDVLFYSNLIRENIK